MNIPTQGRFFCTVRTNWGSLRAFNRNFIVGDPKYEYFSANGDLAWKVTLKATLTYDGFTSRCTSVDNLAVNIYDSDWSVLSKSSSKSGNTATGNVTMAKQFLIGSGNVPVILILSCDKNGNLS